MKKAAWIGAGVVAALAIVWGLNRKAAAPSTAEPAPPKAPEASPRIVSVGGSISELVVALGAGDALVGVDTSSIYPAEVLDPLPKVGYQRRLAAEGVLALNPSLILLGEDAGPPPVVTKLRQAGLQLVQLAKVETPEQAYERVSKLGEILGKSDAAAALNARLKKQVKALTAATGAVDARPRVAFLYARGKGTLYIAGKGSGPEAMIRMAGGENAVTDFEGFRAMSAEGLIAAKPDVLLVTTHGVESLGGTEALRKMPGIAGTPAAEANRIVAIDDLALLGFGPRFAEAGWELARALHGNLGQPPKVAQQ